MDLNPIFDNLRKESHPFFRHLTKDKALADDLSQHALFTLLRCWPKWKDLPLDQLKRLVFTIGRRHYFSLRKRDEKHYAGTRLQGGNRRVSL